MLSYMEAWNGELVAAGETRMDCGWRLAKLSWRLLRSSLSLIVLGLGSVLAAGVAGYAAFSLRGHGSAVPLIALGFAGAVIGNFLQVAVALAADDSLDGSRMTVFEAASESRERLAAIVGWATIATSVQVGLLLLGQALPARAGLFVSLTAAAWAFGIVFVVPMLALDLSTPIEALRESPALLRERWGEEFAGIFGIGGVTFIAAIPAFVLLAAGAHRNRIAPGSANLAVVLGAILLATIFVLGSTTFQVFAVALYRDATVGFPAADDFVERRPRRKSWIVRIGLAILAVLFTLAVIAALLGPRPAEREFKVSFPASYASGVTPGMPVVYEGRRVGVVKGSEISGESDIVTFEVESPYETLKGETSITLSEFEGGRCLVIVPRGQGPPLPQGEAGPA